MRKRYFIFVSLWVAGIILYAQEGLPLYGESNERETYPFMVQVVDVFNEPITDVVVKSLSTNQVVTDQKKGLYTWESSAPDDFVAFIQSGDTICRSLMSSFNKYFLVIDTIAPAPGNCSLYTYDSYKTFREQAGVTNKRAILYYTLGIKYFNGDEVIQDYSKAYKYLNYAAKMGIPNAYGPLARMYYDGKGIAQNYSEAAKYYEKMQDSRAMTRLGEMYMEGLGVEQNYKKAAYYFRLASVKGDKTAAKYLKSLYKDKSVKEEDIVTKEGRLRYPGSAEFPGGDGALYEWLSKTIRYPKECREQGIGGRVVAQFFIETGGSVTEVKILSSPHPALAKEVIRMIYTMPKWKCAEENGKAVRSTYNLPVTFKCH